MGQELEIRLNASFPNQLGTEKMAMDLVEPFLDQIGASKMRLEDIRTILSEACLNAIEHGNGMDESKTYEIELLSAEAENLVIRVHDQGGRSRWNHLPRFQDIQSVMASGQEPRGWGLQMIDQLADEWKFQIEEKSTYLEIKVRLEAGGEHIANGS